MQSPSCCRAEWDNDEAHCMKKTKLDMREKTPTVDMCADVSHLHQTRHGGVDHDEGEELHPPVERDANNLGTEIQRDTLKAETSLGDKIL